MATWLTGGKYSCNRGFVREPYSQKRSIAAKINEPVQRAKGLIHQQNLGFVGQRPRDGDPLLHAARELPRIMIFESLQADQIDQRLGFDLSIAGTASPRLETKAHVAQHGTPGEKGFVEFLKYEDEIGRRAADLSPVHNDFAGARNGEPGNGHEQGGLAATGRADEGNKLSGLDLTGDVFNRHGRLAAELAITLGETLDLDDGHEELITGRRLTPWAPAH